MVSEQALNRRRQWKRKIRWTFFIRLCLVFALSAVCLHSCTHSSLVVKAGGRKRTAESSVSRKQRWKEERRGRYISWPHSCSLCENIKRRAWLRRIRAPVWWRLRETQNVIDVHEGQVGSERVPEGAATEFLSFSSFLFISSLRWNALLLLLSVCRFAQIYWWDIQILSTFTALQTCGVFAPTLFGSD